MGFQVPNATNTTGGNLYAVLGQAEPDSVDFGVLGNIGRSGVSLMASDGSKNLNSAKVTANGNLTVNVAAGVVVLNGTPYNLAANATLALPASPVDDRFDLIVARVSGSVATAVAVAGVEDPTNPTFPPADEQINITYNPSLHIDYDTDVVLAAVYRDGSSNVTVSEIVDKRVLLTSSITFHGITPPTTGQGTPGDIFFQTPSPSNTTQSGVHVRRSDGTWGELLSAPQGALGPFVPIGVPLPWPVPTGPLPAGYVEYDGSLLAIATYPDLFAAYGTEFGGDGITTFGVPDWRNKTPKGTIVDTDAGDEVGSDTVTLNTDNLPSHDHAIGNHDHPMPHTHGMTHNHVASTASAGGHSHGPGSLTILGSNGRNVAFREPAYPVSGVAYITGYIADVTGGYPFPLNGGMVLSNSPEVLVTSGLTSTVSGHTHTVTVNNSTKINTDGVSTPNTGIDSGTTGTRGSNTPYSNVPESVLVRWMVRAL